MNAAPLRLFRRLAAAVAVACLLGGAALAQRAPAPDAGAAAPSADALAAAQELLAASGAAKQFEAVIPTMMNHMANIFVQQQPAHEKTIREMFQIGATRMNERKSELIAEIAALYARTFAAEEMREMTRFFSSGVGKRFIDSQSTILQQSMQLGQRWGEKIGREIETEMRRELRNKGVPI